MKKFVYRASNLALPLLSRLPGQSDAIAIVMVHGVYDDHFVGDVPQPRSSISLRDFERNVLILRNSFSFIGMDDAVAMLRGEVPLGKRCIALTFDDSLKTHVDVIAPKLVDWGLPATFYLSTETIDEQRPYWWLRLEFAMAKSRGQLLRLSMPGGQVEVDTSSPQVARRALANAFRTKCRPSEITAAVSSLERQLEVSLENASQQYPSAQPLSWDDVRRLANMGMTLGAHSVTHPNLTLVDDQALERELTESRMAIERHTMRTCMHFCYPHGFYSDKVAVFTQKAGYKSAVGVEEGWNVSAAPLFKLKRFGLSARDYELGWQLSGIPAMINRVRAHHTTAVVSPAIGARLVIQSAILIGS